MKLGIASVTATVLLLVFGGCSEGVQSTTNPTAVKAQPEGSNFHYTAGPAYKITGEIFTGNLVHLHVISCSGTGHVTFRATGTTAGPYPGTFTSTGHWIWGAGDHAVTWYFFQRVTIVSATTTIYGYIFGHGRTGDNPAGCSGFRSNPFEGGPLKYRIPAFGRGTASADISQSYLNESLD
jgi:hypothetical protein